MTKTVRRLSGLEIDEVSLVDRPANQHGLVAFTKRDEGPMAKYFDAEGHEVDLADVQVGELVYDEAGTEYRGLSDEEYAQLEAEANASGETLDPQGYAEDELLEQEPSPLRELAEVGKAGGSLGAAIQGGVSTLRQTGRRAANRTLGQPDASGHFFNRANVARATQGVSANRRAIGAAGAAGATGYVAGRTRKSLGEEVLEELSKAMSTEDEHQVIAKAMARIDEASERATRAETIAKAQAERAEHLQYVELAKNYELPVEDSFFGGILQKISKALAPDELDVMDRIFTAAGEALVQPEIGAQGYQPSMVMDQVTGYVGDVVGKADGLTAEQATVALFEANPEAYDAYLSEKG